MESVEGEKVVVSAKEDEVVEKIVVENVVEVEKDLKVQEGVSCCNCDAQMTPGHQCELETLINFYMTTPSMKIIPLIFSTLPM